MINALDTDYKQLKRTRKVNGNRVIELDVFPTDDNKQYFDLIVEEAIITFKDDEYVIKKLEEKSIGKKYYKQVTAIHKFYVDLINKQQYDVHNGSITFNNYMNFVFEDTPYENFEVIDLFNAREFENLGDDNRLALLQKGLDRFRAEMELVGSGYKPRFQKMIGNDTDFQFRFGHNIKSISRDIDTSNLATHIRGFGDPELDIYAEYTSPNAAIFGILDAPTVRDERFKSNTAMYDEIVSRIQDEPLVSITIDFVDLRAAGYPYTIPNEGDRIWLIYEPMDDLMIETRILEINETFDSNGKIIKTEVTLANHKKSFANTVFENVQKQLSEIIDDDGIVRYSVLDDAVKIATEALQSAQTQLEFNNGIIAREKDDPNRLVLFNSAGIGISKDGGSTFTTAVTGDGIVADVITAGTLRGINIIGNTIISQNNVTNDVITMDEGKIEFFNNGVISSRVDPTGQMFYYNGNRVADLRAAGFDNDSNYRGLNFIIEEDAQYFSWASIDDETRVPYTKIAWHRTDEYDRKGFSLNDDVYIKDKLFVYDDLEVYWKSALKLYRLRTPTDPTRVITIDNQGIGGQAGVAIRRGVDFQGAGLFMTLARSTLIAPSDDNSLAYLEVRGGSSPRVRSMTIRNREYSQNTDIVKINSDGILGRITSSRRYKLLEENIELERAKLIHLIGPKTWFDKRAVEDYAHTLHTGEETEVQKIERIPGIIAEDLHDAGLFEFVIYDDKNRPDGINNNGWTLLIPISREHEQRLNEYDNRFGTIENRIENLENELAQLKGVS